MIAALWVAEFSSADARIAPHESRIVVGQSQFFIRINSGQLDVSTEDIEAYVRDAARAVISYYGKFPVAKTVVIVSPSNGDVVGFATSTYEDAGGYGLIEIDIGGGATTKDLDKSWTLTHEMMHLGFPIMRRRYRWLAEGIATYIEPIARMRIGKLTREEVWGDLADNLDKGLPGGSDDGGLNDARGFGRVYWGGALYCLLADIEIRKRTGNRIGLENALRAIAEHGGTAASNWGAQQSLQVGDEATGTTVLKDLFDEMSEHPKSIDVPRLLKTLGIKRGGNHVVVDNSAPLAHIRRAIETGAQRRFSAHVNPGP